MNKLHLGLIGLTIVIVLAVAIGGAMGSFVFFALIKFAAIVALVESVPPIRWMAHKFGSVFDVMLFIFSFYMMYASTVTMGVSFTVTAFLFTIVYRPYVRYKQKRDAELNFFKNQRLK